MTPSALIEQHKPTVDGHILFHHGNDEAVNFDTKAHTYIHHTRLEKTEAASCLS